jgi:hypothetical protein
VLGIDAYRLALRNAEERRIETIDVIEERRPLRIALARGVPVGCEELARVPTL